MSRGRPREFDVDRALDQALHVFWHKGFEGATLPDLTAAMGINRPSLYAAFGSKEELFRKALDRYAQGPAAFVREALTAPTARDVARHLFDGSVDLLTHPRNPRGCLMVQGALACGTAADSVRQELVSRREAGEEAIRKRFERAQAEGDLPADADPADLARFVVTVIRGMAVEATGGASREELGRVVELAMRAWPDARRRRPSNRSRSP
ncbi:MAG: TetR/AcrR family transcriptional regulator [Gemmataceae bacterium]|nr:TetR/AcrR family transcriptional regulator [Gemmataceae bacterium]